MATPTRPEVTRNDKSNINIWIDSKAKEGYQLAGEAAERRDRTLTVCIEKIGVDLYEKISALMEAFDASSPIDLPEVRIDIQIKMLHGDQFKLLEVSKNDRVTAKIA